MEQEKKSTENLSDAQENMVPTEDAAPDTSVGESGSAARPQLPLSSGVLRSLEKYLRGDVKILKAASEAGVSMKIFRKEMLASLNRGDIQIRMPRNMKLERQLMREWPIKQHYVLNTSDQDEHFNTGAAEAFLEVLVSVLSSRDSAQPLRIGIAGGNATGGMVNAFRKSSRKWSEFIPNEILPQEGVHVYALNVSQTGGFRQLRGNANVLTYLLAERLSVEFNRKFSPGSGESVIDVEAYGLSASLIQETKGRQKADCNSENRKVLRYTDPKRLKESLIACGHRGSAQNVEVEKGSKLDIVITGVGSVRDSMFHKYCQDNGIDTDRLKDDLVVGDITYHPITRMGEERSIYSSDSKQGEKKKLEFYCAVSLDVLREMNQDQNKRVIVIARGNKQADKTEALHAAITSQENQHNNALCNVAITDCQSARFLIMKMARSIQDVS